MPKLKLAAALVALLAPPAFAGGYYIDQTSSAGSAYAVAVCRLLDQAPVGTVPVVSSQERAE